MNKFYPNPTQVLFTLAPDKKASVGIAYRDEIICACCGGVFELSEEDVRVEKELPWILVLRID